MAPIATIFACNHQRAEVSRTTSASCHPILCSQKNTRWASYAGLEPGGKCNMPNTEWNASLYDQMHSFVSEYGKSLFSVLDPQPGERILDLGCGTGQLAHTISEAGAQVIGIDSA